MNIRTTVSLAIAIATTMMTASLVAGTEKSGQGFVPPPPGPYQSQIERPMAATKPPQQMQRSLPPRMQAPMQRRMPPQQMQPPVRPNWAKPPQHMQAPMQHPMPPPWVMQSQGVPAPLQHEAKEQAKK